MSQGRSDEHLWQPEIKSIDAVHSFLARSSSLQADSLNDGKLRWKRKSWNGCQIYHCLWRIHCYRLRVSLIEFLMTRRLLVGIGEEASGSSLLGSLWKAHIHVIQPTLFCIWNDKDLDMTNTCVLDVSIVGMGIGFVIAWPSCSEKILMKRDLTNIHTFLFIYLFKYTHTHTQ